VVSGDEVHGADPMLRAKLTPAASAATVPTAAGLIRANEIAAGCLGGPWQRLAAGTGEGPRFYDWALSSHGAMRHRR
jgi:hypothetical protein